MNSGELLGLVSIAFIGLASLVQLWRGFATKAPAATKTLGPSEKKKVISWQERLFKGLAKSREEVWGKLANLLSGDIDEQGLEHVEEILYTSDMAPKTIDELLEAIREKSRKEKLAPEQLTDFLYQFLKEKMDPVQKKINRDLFSFEQRTGKTKVIMIVGVNGAGKTTTIGKLATKLNSQGAKVIVGACDTFRAAAVEQLQAWCERAGVEMVRAKDGADPSGVGYDALQKAMSAKADYCLLDTAGRLHTKSNLMDELTKSKKVLSKLDPSAPHEVLLVIDSITGQNALRQAQEFHKALGLTGLIFTKCDGSSKAGNGVSIVDALAVPITYIGVGEGVEDLHAFDVDDYLNALLGKSSTQDKIPTGEELTH